MKRGWNVKCCKRFKMEVMVLFERFIRLFSYKSLLMQFLTIYLQNIHQPASRGHAVQLHTKKKPLLLWYYLSLKIKPEFFSFHVTQFFVVYFIINFNLWKVQGISFILLDKIGKTLFSTSMPNSTTNAPVLSFCLRCWNPNHLTKHHLFYFNQLQRLKF